MPASLTAGVTNIEGGNCCAAAIVREVFLTDELRSSQENIELASKILIAGGGIFFPVRRGRRGQQNADLY
jgi:hypothetical protein